MLVDCFLGNDETKLAEFRIRYLERFVSHTFIVESNKTFSGDQKPLYFAEWWKDLSAVLKSKIMVIELDDSNLTSTDAWARDIFSRESLHKEAIDKFSGMSLILSDLDEIPSHNQVENFLSLQGNYHFRCRTVYRKANLFVQGKHDNWNFGIFSSNPKLLIENGGRFQKLPIVTADDWGIHFSYLGMGPQRLESKLNSFAHTEYQGLDINFTDFLAFCDTYQIDHLGRIRSETLGLLKFESAEKTNSSILISLKAFEPTWLCKSRSQKGMIRRIFASGVASFGMRVSKSGKIHPYRKYLFSRYFYKDSKDIFPPARYFICSFVLLGALLEVFLAFLWNARRIFRRF